jgi:hypothetical protein
MLLNPEVTPILAKQNFHPMGEEVETQVLLADYVPDSDSNIIEQFRRPSAIGTQVTGNQGVTHNLFSL